MKKNIILPISIISFLVLMVFVPKSFSTQENIFFIIEKGEGSKDIAANLEKEGIVWWSQLFRAYVLVRNTSGKIQAGVYQISPSMNILTIAEKFTRGDIAKEKITIPEGFTAEQIHQKLQKLDEINPIDLEELKKHEGYLFPDTYQISYDLKTMEIIAIMEDNFNKKTAGLKITPEIVIMASILEKELQIKEDKKIASGIFWKRIRVGMPLQSCATIAYIKQVGQWRYSLEDTRIESPYNTYLNLGLPIGPISNPGLDSILAAINPVDSLYWYYLSTPEGETIFSKTLQEHNIAKAKYLQ